MKWVKFGVSRHFLENPLRKWPGILHADVSWASSELSRLGSQFVDFSIFGTILTSWNGSNLGTLVMICGFPHYGAPLTEIGHIWGFWALSGECVGVNVEGGAEAYKFCLVETKNSQKYSVLYTLLRQAAYMCHKFCLSLVCCMQNALYYYKPQIQQNNDKGGTSFKISPKMITFMLPVWGDIICSIVLLFLCILEKNTHSQALHIPSLFTWALRRKVTTKYEPLRVCVLF